MPALFLDYNATTPVDPRVADVMDPYLREHYGNPGSAHALGRRAQEAVVAARGQVAALLGCSPGEILFTSGGTESNNHALKGACWAREAEGRHIVISAVEHPAVVEPVRWLAARGWDASIVPVDRHCRVDPDAVAAAVRPDTVIVSIMHANNETGALQPIAEIAGIVHAAGAWLHVDAAQSAGKVPVKVDDLGCDLLSLASHKLYAPKGLGVLYIRAGVELERLVHGAGQESGRRAGTENVALIAGLGEAARLADADVDEERPRLSALRDRLQAELLAARPEAVVHSADVERLPNTLSIGFPGRSSAELMAACPDLLCSAGAACHGSGGGRLSAVLSAMGVELSAGLGTLRLSLGRFSTAEDVDRAVVRLLAATG